MPLYEYKCQDCGHRFEVLQRLGEGAEGQKCPGCNHHEVSRLFSTFAAATGSNGSPSTSMQVGGGCCQGTPT